MKKEENISTDNLIHDMDRDGYVFIRNFFTEELAAKAFEEIKRWYDADRKEREEKGIRDIVYTGPAGLTVLTNAMHIMTNAYGKSPVLDNMFEKILTDPLSSKFLEVFAGKNIKLRGFNIQYLTGAYDPKPTIGPAPSVHDWHRDSLGEINISVMLDDFEGPDNGATALIKGTHTFPYSPRWNCLFGYPYNNDKGLKVFLKLNPFSRKLARKVLKNATGAYGKRGDVYLFANDIWHGREPNLHGKRGMRLMIGAFPTDFPYPDQVKPLPDEILQKLPPNVKRVAGKEHPVNTEKNALIHKIINSQKPPAFLDLFYMARLERRTADFFTRVYWGIRESRLYYKVRSIKTRFVKK